MTELRAADRGDAPALAELYAQSFPASARNFSTATVECWVSRHDSGFWAQVCDSEDEVVVIDGPSGRLLGMAVGCLLPEGGGELDRLFVDPDHWGEGVGSALHDHVIGVLPRPAVLWVLEGNDRATDFYGRRGWCPTGARKVQQCEQSGQLRWFEMALGVT